MDDYDAYGRPPVGSDLRRILMMLSHSPAELHSIHTLPYLHLPQRDGWKYDLFSSQENSSFWKKVSLNFLYLILSWFPSHGESNRRATIQ